MIQWYYADAQRQRHGPVEDRDIRALYQRGELNAQTLVWREGLSEWASLESLSEELALHTTAPAATGGIDLRGDLAAIANGTAPLPGTGGGTHSPYAASSTAMGSGHGAVYSDGQVVYAGFWKRFAAYMIDYLVLLIPSWIIGAILGVGIGFGMGVAGGGDAASSIIAQLVSGLVGLIIALAYYSWFHASAGGATLGKMAIGIKVVRGNGERLTIGRSIGRQFATILSSLTLLIGYLLAAFTDRKQALHDMICDTIVVDRWAFTDQPELQSDSLGTVTIVVLILSGLLLIILGIIFIAMIGAVLASMGG